MVGEHAKKGGGCRAQERGQKVWRVKQGLCFPGAALDPPQRGHFPVNPALTHMVWVGAIVAARSRSSMQGAIAPLWEPGLI